MFVCRSSRRGDTRIHKPWAGGRAQSFGAPKCRYASVWAYLSRGEKRDVGKGSSDARESRAGERTNGSRASAAVGSALEQGESGAEHGRCLAFVANFRFPSGPAASLTGSRAGGVLEGRCVKHVFPRRGPLRVDPRRLFGAAATFAGITGLAPPAAREASYASFRGPLAACSSTER